MVLHTGLRKDARAPACLVYLAVVSVLLGPCHSAVYADYKLLARDLFASYSPEIRPVVNSSAPLRVNVSFWLTSIHALDEINQHLESSAFFRMMWEDSSLAWQPSSYNDIRYFAYPQMYIWIPDMTIQNSVESMTQLGFDRNYLYINAQGIIRWIVGGVYKTSCNIDITFYPFDTQVCDITLTTLVSSGKDIDLSVSREPYVLDWYSESGTWDLLSITVEEMSTTRERTRVSFSLTLKRLRLYYVVAIIFPVLFLSFTATLVFALPADSGEKMGTSITVLLAFAVYLTIVSDQMPHTSAQVSILAVYLTMLLGQTAVGVVLTVWILNLNSRTDEHPPGWRMRKVVLILRTLMRKDQEVLPSKPTTTEEKASDSAEGDTYPEIPSMSWTTVSHTIDRFFFYVFSFMLALLTVIFMSIMMFNTS